MKRKIAGGSSEDNHVFRPHATRLFGQLTSFNQPAFSDFFYLSENLLKGWIVGNIDIRSAAGDDRPLRFEKRKIAQSLERFHT